MDNKLLHKTANTIRGISIDAVQKANSGHPGLPLGMADVGTVLFSKFLKYNPANPNWFNRDRFVMSGGHGSALIYSLLNIFGYDLTLDDIKNFRQWGSKTPGHPEYKHTPGIETTTGPLGQGIANAVGMALAETILAAKYNTENTKIVNHHTYVMAGDGDLQEGISHEVSSFAGHFKLKKLIVLYDSNDITIDGETNMNFTENVSKRYKAYGWHVLKIDGHNNQEIEKAIKKAKKTKKPSLIICRTTIGYGSPNKAGTSSVHGAPLGENELKLTKEKLGIDPKDFFIPNEIKEVTENALKKGKKAEGKWIVKLENFKKENLNLAEDFEKCISEELSDSVFEIPDFDSEKGIATRSASGKILEHLEKEIPFLIGGSADLTPSNNTKTKNQTAYCAKNRKGQYLHYGVREHGMASIMNGLTLHGGCLPYSGTFFVFSDYMRPAIRMAALMGLRVIYVFTHDSIGLGEDGPTHQPIEHLTSLRVIPNLVNFRPADANETAIGWKIALKRKNGPTSLILTRQALPVFDRSNGDFSPVEGAEKGAYVLTEDNDYEFIISASGSEVETAVNAKEILNSKGIKVRIVSFPSTELFEDQSSEYKNSVFPKVKTKRIFIEAGCEMSWNKYAGDNGKIISIERFGASAPYKTLFEKFGITAEKIVETVNEMI